VTVQTEHRPGLQDVQVRLQTNRETPGLVAAIENWKIETAHTKKSYMK